MAMMMAINKEPRQIDPNDVVIARLNALLVGAGSTFAGTKYHVANAPAAVTCTTLRMTCPPQYNDTKKPKYAAYSAPWPPLGLLLLLEAMVFNE